MQRGVALVVHAAMVEMGFCRYLFVFSFGVRFGSDVIDSKRNEHWDAYDKGRFTYLLLVY